LRLPVYIMLLQLFNALFWQPPLDVLFPYTTLFRASVARTTSRRRHRAGSCPVVSTRARCTRPSGSSARRATSRTAARSRSSPRRSEEHTSELQSREKIVCRLLHAKKKESHPALHVA